MESSLQESLPLLENSQKKFSILIHDDRYTITGYWKLSKLPDSQSPNDSPNQKLSFNHLISLDHENFLIHPDDAKEFGDLVRQLSEAVHTHFSFRIIGVAGTVMHIEAQGTVSEASVSNATEGQSGHQRTLLSKIIESSPDIIQLVNLESGRWAYINTMLPEVLQYPFEEIKRIENENRLTELIHPDDLKLYHGFLDQVRGAANEDTIETELRWRAFNGSWMWFRMRARIFERNGQGTPLKFLAFSQNVTDRKQAEEEKRKHQLLREVEKARTAFFNHVSHEFRTPLTLLLAPLQDVLQRGDIPRPELTQLEMAYRNALRLQKLVNSLLDFASIESGKLEAIFRPTDLASFTADLASNFRAIIEHVDLKFVVKCPKLSEPVYVNHEMYEKILFNLLSNAFKFTFDGKITVKVSENKNHVKLMVGDTGTGIPRDQMSKIFDRFSRVEGARARTYEGSGIGLSLVRELVRFHGATIKVSSVVGEGTQFTINFLKGKTHLRSRNVFESREIAPGVGAAPYMEELKGWTTPLDGIDDNRLYKKRSLDAQLPKPFVLVVDDNSDMRTYIKNLLSEDYEVTAAANGKVALEAVQHGMVPELILADVMMPETDGYMLLDALRQNKLTAEIPVILISAKAGEAARIEGFRYGADDYLVKPFSAKELLARVDARIQIARARQTARQTLVNMNEQLEQNVTDRSRSLLQANEDLIHKNAELENLNSDLSTFTFVAGHDLSEPLRKIQTFTSMILERGAEILPERTRELVDKINAAASRMRFLIAEILTYAQAQPDAEAITAVDLSSIVDQVKADLYNLIAERNAVIEYGSLPVIHCDPLQFSRLLQNILSNAIKFCPPGRTPRIFITSVMVDGDKIHHAMAIPGKKYLRINISDNGIGFDQEHSERIFQMFQRLHSRHEYPGTGMGLAICKKIVENHGGFIMTTSKPGEGATFSCYFPEAMISAGH